MPRKKLPVTLVVVYPARDGFRYTGRGQDGKVLVDSTRGFKSRRDARAEAQSRWPAARVTFDLT